MPTNVLLPQWGMGMNDGTIVKWLKQEGDAVEIGDPLCEVESAKVNSEVESPGKGTLARNFSSPDKLRRATATGPPTPSLSISSNEGGFGYGTKVTSRSVAIPARSLAISTARLKPPSSSTKPFSCAWRPVHTRP